MLFGDYFKYNRRCHCHYEQTTSILEISLNYMSVQNSSRNSAPFVHNEETRRRGEAHELHFLLIRLLFF